MPRSQIHPHTCAQPLLHCPLSGIPTCKAHPTPFLLKCKSFFNVLSVSVCIYAREREWVYGYKWVCDAHTHTRRGKKPLMFPSFKANQKVFPRRASALRSRPLPLPPRPRSCSKPTFFLSSEAFPISPSPFEAFGRHLHILSITWGEALLCKSLYVAKV